MGSLDWAETQGEEATGCCSVGRGSTGSRCSLSLEFLRPGDLVNLEDAALPCELLGSSLDLSRSFSLTISVDFLRTNPAASRAVVARCMILTLPERAFLLSFSLSLRLPPGVDGCERVDECSPVMVEADGESKGERVLGVVGGVLGLTVVGVAGRNASWGADCAEGM